MKVLLDVFGAGARTTLVLFKDFLIPTRAREAEVDRTRKGFPHLPAEAIWKSDLDKARRLGIAEEREVATMNYGGSGSRKSRQ
jgi:hypothetical protein